jgi:hypothetical protein
MEIALQILLSLTSLICFLVGTIGLIKGIQYVLPASIESQKKLDNAFRFLNGMFASFAFLLMWVVLHIHEIHDLIYFIGIVVLCAGLGRLYSRIKVGSAGSYLLYAMLFEIMLGMGIVLLQYFR